MLCDLLKFAFHKMTAAVQSQAENMNPNVTAYKVFYSYK